jgi:hypothetical protein
MLDTLCESFFTRSRLLRTSSVASSDTHSPFVAARLGGGLATSDQEEASSETEIVGFLKS